MSKQHRKYNEEVIGGTKEIWKDVIGFEEYYMVSNKGRVMSKERTWIAGVGQVNHRNPSIKKLTKTYYGYLCTTLCKDAVKKVFLVHRIVAEAFIPNPKEYTEINHIDYLKTNNSVENSEWCDRSHNGKHAYDNGLNIVHKYSTKRSVINIKTREIFESVSYISRKLKIHNSTLTHQLKNNLSDEFKYTNEYISSLKNNHDRLVEALNKIIKTAPLGLGGWDALQEAKELSAELKA